MREMEWLAPRPDRGVLIETRGFRAEGVDGLGLTLISGDLDAAIAALSAGAPTIGLGPRAPDGPHALRVARDCALLVTPAPLDFEEGWRAEGWSAMRLDDGMAVVALTGAKVDEVLMQGTSIDPSAGSRSAALMFAGLRCLLARTTMSTRLYCEAASREALLDWLAGA